MNCQLIVNQNGLLSACPTDEDFARIAYHTDGLLVEPVAVHPSTYKHLWANRDNVYVLHPDLPEQVDEPGRVWYHIKNGHLRRV